IIRGNMTSAQMADGIIIQTTGPYTALLFNNVVYDFTNHGFLDNTNSSSVGTIYFSNNTISACNEGLTASNSKIVARNNIFDAIPSAGACVEGSDATVGSSDYNVCNLAETPFGGHSVSGASASFANPDGGDFHLRPNDMVAMGHGIDLSDDSNAPFDVD